MEWVFILIVSGSTSATQTVTKVAEAQCLSMIATYEKHADPIMAYCFGPAGEAVMTTDVPTRMSRLLRPQQPAPHAEKPKARVEM